MGVENDWNMRNDVMCVYNMLVCSYYLFNWLFGFGCLTLPFVDKRKTIYWEVGGRKDDVVSSGGCSFKSPNIATNEKIIRGNLLGARAAELYA